MLDDALVPPGTVFVAHDEVKQSVGTKKVLKIYLVDKDGKKHLAATGEDLGDAHYHYRTTKPFSKYGVIDCHNRKELTMWLEMVIAESKGKEGPHLDADDKNPEGVFFTSHKYERAQMADGRRINRWYLVDQHGSAHLAVIGIERDTKDGHYTYNAEQPFATMIPLQCSNQSGVFKWLEMWITHHAAGTAAVAQTPGEGAAAPSATLSGGAAASGPNAPGLDPAGRKPPLFISLSAIRQARKSSSALLAESALAADAAATHAATKPALAKSKPAPPAAVMPSSVPVPPAPVAPAPQPAGPKQKSLGIVQQNQIKKARKLQEDARAEQERLIAGHLMRLRRAAAAEVRGDNAAKQVTMSWLQGGFNEDEREALEHWVALLSAVLDLQQQHRQWQREQAGADDTAALRPGAQQQPTQQQQQEQEQQQQQPDHAQDSVPPGDQQQRQQQQQEGQAQQAAPSGAAPSELPAPAEGAVMTDKELLAWLRQPGNERHHLRIMLECLKEIGAADLPARVLLGHKVVGLVQRCLAEPADEAVRSLAQHMLRRWRWQLAGHMQVLTNPVYMEDHLALLEDDIAAGAVPVPQLPKHKQALLDTHLPSLPGSNSGRLNYTPQHASHHHHHLQSAGPGSAPPAMSHHPAAAHTPGQVAPGALAGFAGTRQAGLGIGAQGFEGLMNPAALGLMNPGQLGTPSFSTPMHYTAAALYRAGSPALAPAPGSNGIQHLLLQSAAASAGVQPSAVSAADVYGLSSAPNMLTGPFVSAGLPALTAEAQHAAVLSMVPMLQQQQQYQHQQLSHQLVLQQQQQYLQAQGLAAALAAGPHLLQGLVQPDAVAQLVSQQQQLAGQQQWLGLGQVTAGQLHQQQQGLQQQQQAAWQGLAGGSSAG